ncbi:hypothetical protein BGW38_007268 [Lunasporangiospora selenospora]|uniref:Uncharacterized protein n=1 Tax=Lunasporangiospora selenospora TaxID=979761 RepID=A0A9P6FKU7_9FUNG|nr:hypothetical protein BGW38_007268 [Lunasporangiospora selenospora]
MAPESAAVHRSSSASDMAPNKPKYAGPTFHNAPAPASLPLPSFHRSAGPVEPVAVAQKSPQTMPFFAEAAAPHLNSMSYRAVEPMPPMTPWVGHLSMPASPNPYHHHQQHFQQHPYYSHPHHGSYNVPERMATSGFIPSESPMTNGGSGDDQLMEISRNIRMLLKIQGQ